jgi:hypothetical protein
MRGAPRRLPKAAISGFWALGFAVRTDNPLFTPPRSSLPSVALRPRVAARSSMRGASWPATQAALCGRRALIQSLGRCGSGGRQRLMVHAVRSGSRGLEHKLITPASHAARSSLLSASLRPHVVARSPMSGASLPAMGAGGCGREALIQHYRIPSSSGL